LVQGHWVTIKEVEDDGVVPVGSKLISHQLGVLPDTDDIWKIEDCGILVDGISLWFGGLKKLESNL
jgi:hypothetical protein